MARMYATDKCTVIAKKQGDPKTKFLRLVFSTVRRPTIRPTIKKKTSPDIAPVRRTTSDLRPG